MIQILRHLSNGLLTGMFPINIQKSFVMFDHDLLKKQSVTGFHWESIT